jgi:hypothetical protein
MNRTIIFIGVVIFLIISWLTTFINTLHDDVDINYGFEEKAMVSNDKRMTLVNSQGNEVLLLNKLSLQEKKSLWNSSLLKEDMLKLFPHFSEMRYFVEKHIEDDGEFKEQLLAHINSVELTYIGGSMTGQSAKTALSKF